MVCQIIDELRNRQPFRSVLAKLARKGQFVGRKKRIGLALRVFDRQRFGQIPLQGEVNLPWLLMSIHHVSETAEVGQAPLIPEFQHLRAIRRVDGLLQHQQQLQNARLA